MFNAFIGFNGYADCAWSAVIPKNSLQRTQARLGAADLTAKESH